MPLVVQGASGSGAVSDSSGRYVVVDLANGVASFINTKYTTRYRTRYVSRYVSNVMRVVTALTVNYMLNGSVYTRVVIPTRIVEKTQLSSESSKQGQGISVNVNEGMNAGKWVRNKEVRSIRTLPRKLPNTIMV